MPFNSFQFVAFFFIVYCFYLLSSHKWQNRLLLAASCFFYGSWDWRFLFLIFTSITIDYFCGLKIHGSDDENVKKRFLILSILVNLSILGFFKYFNFFISNFTGLIDYFGLSIQPRTLNIVLPVGISFYTLKTLSYTFDVYTDKIKPARSYSDYALFVIFFPLLLAGPIMRAGELLPQISSKRKLRLDEIGEGCYFIFWGLFQKIFIADNLAKVVDPVFNSSAPYDCTKIILALYAFAFQIYCDFAGYSNMARGLGKCMGFDIMVNFNFPYFSTNPQEFWARWHISLSAWFRDYLYIPISFSKREWGKWGVIFALMITFIICGVWHGAAWTFVLWGAYQGFLLVIYQLFKTAPIKMPILENAFFKKIWYFSRMFFFFQLISIGWLFFRVKSFSQALQMLRSLAGFLSNLQFDLLSRAMLIDLVFFTIVLVIVEYFQHARKDLTILLKAPFPVKLFVFMALFYLLVIFGEFGTKEFIYSQF